MATENFNLIVITPEEDIANEAGFINQLFEAGLQLLHIRKPANSIQQTKKMLQSISPAFHPKIVIHSHYELLNNFELKGIHLPERVRKEGNISGLKNIVSTSFHTLEDIKTEKMNFEYAFFSPVFQSISKQGYEPATKIEKIKEFFKSNTIRVPIIALGGITGKNILQLPDIGFNGAACMGYIWKNANPLEQFEKLQKILRA